MKIRIISDLHLDINDKNPFELSDTETFTVICGDISGYFEKTSDWLNKYIKNGVFVSGNHVVYNESNHSLQYFINQFEQAYPLSASVSYLNNNYKIVNDIVFVGGTLWTDYKLLDKNAPDLYMMYASGLLNDFNWGKFNSNFNEDKEDEKYLRELSPTDCAEMFEQTIAAIDNVCKKFPDKKIVVVTHHAPSILSIQQENKTKISSPCFASNLEEFILNHTNIKLWCHGHIHQASDYKIGDCRIVCNPRGYAKYGEDSNFNPDLVVEI